MVKFCVFWGTSSSKTQNASAREEYIPRKMLFLANEPAKKAEINIFMTRDTTGPGF